MASRAEIYKVRAAECEAIAAAAISAAKRATFTELATQWRKLIRQLEMLENEDAGERERS
jgi:hypothetical protein